MDLLTDQGPFLRLLTRTSKTQAIAVLKTLTDDQTKIMSEIAVKLLKGNLPAPIQRLKLYKTILREIGRSPKNIKINGRKIKAKAVKMVWHSSTPETEPQQNSIALTANRLRKALKHDSRLRHVGVYTYNIFSRFGRYQIQEGVRCGDRPVEKLYPRLQGQAIHWRRN